MKPRIQGWRPDTCRCNTYLYTDENGVERFIEHEEAVIIHQQIYEQYPQDTLNPSTNPQPVDMTCPFHDSIATAEEHGQVMLSENQTKNKALGELSKEPKLQKDALVDGKIEKVLDESLVSWSFDENRELVLDIPTLTASEKTKVLSDLSKIDPKIKLN